MDCVNQMNCIFTKSLFACAQQAEMLILKKKKNTQVKQYEWGTQFFDEAEIWFIEH